MEKCDPREKKVYEYMVNAVATADKRNPPYRPQDPTGFTLYSAQLQPMICSPRNARRAKMENTDKKKSVGMRYEMHGIICGKKRPSAHIAISKDSLGCEA